MWSFSILHRLILMDCAGIKRVKIPVALYIEPRLFDVCKTLRLCAADALSSIFWLSFCYKLCMIRYDAMWYDTLVHHIRLKSMCIYCAMQRQRIFFFYWMLYRIQMEGLAHVYAPAFKKMPTKCWMHFILSYFFWDDLSIASHFILFFFLP